MTASNSRTVVPGDWFGIFGDGVTVLLPPTAKPRVAALWEAVDEGAGFDELLDSLIRDGLRELPGFVLVSAEGSDVKVVIRGAATASFATTEGPVEVSGSPDSTWVERTLSGVSGLSVEVGEGDGTSYAAGAGLLRVCRVEQSLGDAPTSTPAPNPVPVVEPVVEPVPEPVVEPEVAPSTPDPVVAARVPPPVMGEPIADPIAPEAQPRPKPTPGPQPEPESVVAAPVVPESVVPAPVLPPGDPFAGDFLPPAQPSPQPPSESARAPVPPPSPAVVSPEIDEDTQAGGLAPEDLTPATDPAVGQPPAVTARAVARLIFSSGETVTVDRSVLVGRAPEPRNFSATDQPHVVRVPSPNQEISSTHLEIRPGTAADHGTAVATDLGSTNGTVVVQPGLPPEDLQPGIAVQLIPGAILDLGEGVTIQVTGA